MLIRESVERFQAPKNTISDHLKAHKTNKIVKKLDTLIILSTDQEGNSPIINLFRMEISSKV